MRHLIYSSRVLEIIEQNPILTHIFGVGTLVLAVAEVQRVLSRFECSSSPHAVAADLINVYDRLKQAMVELFGGHSTFALGLNKGSPKLFRACIKSLE